MKANKNIYWVDLFSGAGGTSTGIHLAGQKVVACVNHDADAIAAHQANHPDTIHLTEDIRDFNVVRKLKQIVAEIRRTDPLALIAVLRPSRTTAGLHWVAEPRHQVFVLPMP